MVADAENVERGTKAVKINADVERSFRGSWSGYERDKFFYNPDGPCPQFFDAAYVLGTDFDDDGRAAAPVDVDGDGDLDLVLLSLQGLKLIENRAQAKHFARVRLHATTSHASALGDVVVLKAGGVVQRDYVKATDGFLSQVPLDLHFGLGDATQVDEVEVKWPGGATQTWRGLPADLLLELTEGRPEAGARKLARWPDEGRPRKMPPFSLDSTARRLDGAVEAIASKGRPAILNFWAPDCAPCKEEMPAISALAGERGEEIQVAGICLDPTKQSEAADVVRTLGIGYRQFVADDALVRRFFGGESRIPIPSTFVFDASGRLRRAFQRVVSSEELKSLLDSFREEGAFYQDLVVQGVDFLVRLRYDEALEKFRAARVIRPGEPATWLHEGMCYVGLGKHELAAQAFRTCIGLDPGYSKALYNLGIALRKLGRPAEAIGPLASAIRQNPEEEAWVADLGAAYAESGNLTEALAVFEDGLKLRPAWSGGKSGKAKVLLLLGRVDEAVSLLTELLAAGSGTTANRLDLAKGLLLLKRPNEARTEIIRVLAADPRNVEAANLIKSLERK